MKKAIKDAEEVLGDLSIFPSKFAFVGVHMSLSSDLVKLMYESVWKHFYTLVDTVLMDRQQCEENVEAVVRCLDLLG